MYTYTTTTVSTVMMNACIGVLYMIFVFVYTCIFFLCIHIYFYKSKSCGN